MRRHRTTAAASAATVVVHHTPWLPWVWPWAMCLLLLPAGLAMHMLWGTDLTATPLGAVVLALGTVGLCAYTWRAGRARGPLLRWHAVISVAVAGVWLIAALIAGPLVRPVIDLWAVLLAGLGTTWCIRHALRGHGEDGTGRGWDDVAAKVGLAKSRMFNVRQDGLTVRATVEPDRGVQSSADVAAAAAGITSLYGVPATGFRSVPDPDDAALAHITLVTKDLLADPMPWPGPSAAGGSITQPLILGIRENGDPLKLWLPAEPRLQRPAVNLLLAGMTRAGKSHTGRLISAEVLTRCDAELHIVNVVKGAQFLGPFIGHPRVRIYRELAEVQHGLGALLQRVAERAEHLGQRGLDEWEPGCGLPFEVWLIEEMASAIATSRVFAQITQQCGSTGVSMVPSGQRVTAPNIPSDARRQMGAALQFGCQQEPRAQDYAISEDVIRRGASPWVWGNSRQGYCYAQIPGTDPDLWAAPARTFAATAEDIRIAVQTPDAFTAKQAEIGASNHARAEFLERLEEMLRGRQAVIRPKDFDDIRNKYGRSPSWASKFLAALVTQGKLEDAGHGIYRWRVPESVGAGR